MSLISHPFPRPRASWRLQMSKLAKRHEDNPSPKQIRTFYSQVVLSHGLEHHRRCHVESAVPAVQPIRQQEIFQVRQRPNLGSVPRLVLRQKGLGLQNSNSSISTNATNNSNNNSNSYHDNSIIDNDNNKNAMITAATATAEEELTLVIPLTREHAAPACTW